MTTHWTINHDPAFSEEEPDSFYNLVPSETCVVAFASVADNYGEMHRFEFSNTLKEMGVAYVLIRDSTDYRSQFGVLGIGDRNEVVQYLAKLAGSYSRFVLTGVSAGSTAALLYGQLMALQGFDTGNVEVIVISPFTDLGIPAKEHGLGPKDYVFGLNWQTRGPWNIQGMDHLHDIEPIFRGVGPLVSVRAFYSDGDSTELDLWQAQRVGITDITLIPGASHSGLGRLMRDTGQLQKALLGLPID